MFFEAYFVFFISILVMELGDKTQLAVINLAATNKSSLRIFIGATGLAVVLGIKLVAKTPRNLLKKIAAILFIAIGILTILEII